MSAKPRARRVPSDLVAGLRGRVLRSPKPLHLVGLGLVEILAEVRDSGKRQRRKLARHLPENMPEDVAARVLVAVGNPESALPVLYEIFKEYIERETAAIRLKHIACVRCETPTPGNVGVPGVGWLCREHYLNERISVPQFKPYVPVNPREALYGLPKKSGSIT